MKRQRERAVRHQHGVISGVAASAVALLIVTGLPVSMSGQEGPRPIAAGDAPRVGVVEDWTHHHLVFSNSGTADAAIRTGTFDRWSRIVSDPRYQMQQARRSLSLRPVVGDPNGPLPTQRPERGKKAGLGKDWTTNLGGPGVKATQTGLFSGTTTVNLTQTATVTNGSNALALTMSGHEFTITVNSTPSSGNTVTIGSTIYQFETSSSSCTSGDRCVHISGTTTTATNLVSAIGGSCYNTCSGNDPDVLALSGGSGIVDVINQTTGTISPWTTSSTTHFTLSSGSFTQTVTNTCTSSTVGAFIISSNTATLASNLAAALTACNSSYPAVGVTAVRDGTNTSQVDVTAAAPGAGGDSITLANTVASFSWTAGALSGGVSVGVQPNAFPAKFSLSTTTASCANDFVVYPTGVNGAANAANIIAYNNLYTTGCATGTVPSVYWAYNTGGAVTTSPILSYLDNTGPQVAFVQVSGSAASLVLLKWSSSTGGSVGSPATLTTQSSASAYRTCTAPCMYTVSLGANDTYSAPFYSYGGDDALYVGDDAGRLHKFTGVFLGTTIAEASGFPVVLNASNRVSSPVYDPVAGYVFVGDMGGYVYSVGSGNLGTTAGHKQATTAQLVDAVADAPLVDSGSALYVFGGLCVANYATSSCVFELSAVGGLLGSDGVVAIGGGAAGGTGVAGYYLYAGSFDNVFYSSTNHTGNLYVLANPGKTTGAELDRIPIISGGMGTVAAAVTGLTVSATGAYPWPSPVTEFCNGTCTVSGGATTSGTDYVFFSVNYGNESGCTKSAGNGCILSYNVSNPSAVAISGTGLDVTTPGANGCWATSGIVIDNSVASGTLAGASQIYFVNLNGNAAGNPSALTNSNCTAGSTAVMNATQASQASP